MVHLLFARRILNTGGTYTCSQLGAGAHNLWLSIVNPIQRLVTKHNVFFPGPTTRRWVLAEIRRRLETGEFQPLLDREYPHS